MVNIYRALTVILLENIRIKMYLSYNLDWSIHIHNVRLKANRRISVLRSFKILQGHTGNSVQTARCQCWWERSAGFIVTK